MRTPASTMAMSSGGRFSAAYAINDSGVIVGYAQDSTGQTRAVAWFPIPEPLSQWVIAGLIIVATRRILRRRLL